MALPATFESMVPGEVDQKLREEFQILVRTGLHCAPLAHRTLGSYPDGTVRFSMSYYTTLDDVSHAVDAVREIAKR